MYVGIVAWFVFCCFICNEGKKQTISNNTFYYLFLPLLIVIMGLRDVTVGVDTRNYFTAFELASTHSVKEIFNGELYLAMEKSYLLFMRGISLLVHNYYVFQFMFATVYISGMVFFLKQNTKEHFFSTALFLGLDLYLTAFNLQRQMFAVMLSLLAWESMKKHKWKTTILLGALAISIHRTAIVFAFASLIYFFRKNKTILRLATLAIIVVGIRFEKVLGWLSMNVSEYRNYYGNHKTIQTAGRIWIIWGIVMIMSIITIMKKDKEDSENIKDSKKSIVKDEKVVAVFSLLYIIPNIIGLYFNVAQRIGLYFLPFVILLFINFENVLNEAYRLKYRYGVMFCFLAYFILTSRSSQYDYHFCF